MKFTSANYAGSREISGVRGIMQIGCVAWKMKVRKER